MTAVMLRDIIKRAHCIICWIPYYITFYKNAAYFTEVSNLEKFIILVCIKKLKKQLKNYYRKYTHIMT
jgi:hypothetical protein